MHPDAIIAGLRQELAQNPEREQAILEEIKRVDGQDRPTIVTTEPAVLSPADFDRSYLAGLRQELATAAKDRGEEIKAEIHRVERVLRPAEVEQAESKEKLVSEPSGQEIEERKQARTRKGVEHARKAPVPGQPVPAEKAPGQGAKEKSADE
jgi:hypothetical protein